MSVNKVVFGDQTLMDITDSTVDPGTVIEGNVFYDRSGARMIGSLGPATQNSNGLLTAADKQKLDNIMCGSTEYWNSRLNFIPPEGAIIMYQDGTSSNIKIGDGLAYCVDLPFVTDSVKAQILAALGTHITDMDVHVTAAKQTFWNNKLNCDLQDEMLIFNRE